MSNLSASSVERAMLCPASAVLPQEEGEQTSASKRGTSLHMFIADCLTVGREAALANDLIRRPRAKQRDLKEMDLFPIQEVFSPGWIGDIYPERVFFYDWMSGAACEMPQLTDRDYSEASATVIPMTLDLVDGYNKFVEVKTGIHQVSPTQWNWQIKTNALGLARARNLDSVHAHLAQLVGSVFRVEHYEFGAFDLDCIADELRDLKLRIVDENADVNPSEDACRFCKCKAACPAWKQNEAVEAR